MCRCAPPPWWGVLCWRVARLMVRRAALLWGPSYGGACCVGASRASMWGLRCWCLPASVVVRGVVVLGLGCRHLCRLRTGVVGFGLPVSCAACFVGSASSLPPYGRRDRVAVVGGPILIVAVMFEWPGLVLCYCVAPHMVGFAALVRAPPPW